MCPLKDYAVNRDKGYLQYILSEAKSARNMCSIMSSSSHFYFLS